MGWKRGELHTSRCRGNSNQIRPRDEERGSEIGGFKLWLKYRRDVDEKYQAGRDKFLRILREAGLLHMPKKKGVKTTDSRHSLPLYPDLRYDLIPERPDQLWVSDISYVHLENGKVLYLCLITDAYTHAILGWRISETMEAKQTLEALEMAIEGEKAKGRHLKGLIHHSDRGSQYASVAYTARLKEEGIQISITQCGNPKDNAVAERVNGTLKNELCGSKVSVLKPSYSSREMRNSIGN